MMRASDKIRLRHTLDAVHEALGFVAGRVCEEVQAAHPEIPWFEIIGMRNRLIHGYFDVNPDVVWDTVQSNLPPLVEALTTLLQSE